MSDLTRQCMSLLRSMRSVTEWDDGQRQLYAVVLGDMEPETAIAAVKECVLTLAWRPAPSELREIALRRTLSLPFPSDVETEIMALVDLYGVYGSVDPNYPNTRFVGSPEMTAFTAKIVEMLGGWSRLCTEPTEGRVPLDKRISQAHSEVRSRILSGDPAVSSLLSDARKLVRPDDSAASRLESVRGVTADVIEQVSRRLLK